MKYHPIPLGRIQLGRPLPIDIWSPDGRLLLRRGQTLRSESHREMLAQHQAGMTQSDAMAWQKSLERTMRALRTEGVDLATLAMLPMPAEILDSDYCEGMHVDGGWLDVQDVLRGLLYQGHHAVMPAMRLTGIEQKVLALLREDPDEALFILFQALPDLSLGYCATHALLCAVVGALTAEKLAQNEDQSALLLRSALVMNIGMAQPQDKLARQRTPPNPAQRTLIATHAPTGVEILRDFGICDDILLEFVQWHHAPQDAPIDPAYASALHVLHLADAQIAKMAPRASRPAMSSLHAVKSLVLQDEGSIGDAHRAMAAVLGFYPPGSYVQLVNGEVAVVVKRGLRANAPHVASILGVGGMPLAKYVYHDTAEMHTPQYAVRSSVPASAVHVRVHLERIRRLRVQHGI
ncbi:HD-GYP domain-containing protein [Candidatus Symbiobacter mobilis]|nr:hypothetical protein [Candidatus Symbiobacter mobilis]